MNTLSMTLFLLLASSDFNDRVTVINQWQEIAQDSVKIWRQRAETAAREALMQKRLAEKMAGDLLTLKKRLEECEAKNKN